MLTSLLICVAVSVVCAVLVLLARRDRGRPRRSGRRSAVDVPRMLRRTTLAGGAAGLVATITVATALGFSHPGTAKKSAATSSTGGTSNASETESGSDSLAAPATAPSVGSSSGTTSAAPSSGAVAGSGGS